MCKYNYFFKVRVYNKLIYLEKLFIKKLKNKKLYPNNLINKTQWKNFLVH